MRLLNFLLKILCILLSSVLIFVWMWVDLFKYSVDIIGQQVLFISPSPKYESFYLMSANKLGRWVVKLQSTNYQLILLLIIIVMIVVSIYFGKFIKKYNLP